jgi:hypothetical protein
MIKKIFLVLSAALIVIQFIRPTKNVSGEKSNDISTKYKMSDSVRLVFDKACADCHSNNTKYPWYASVQPLGLWLDHHVDEGKSEFNINEFAAYRIAKQNHKLEEVIEQVKEGEMPLKSYTLIHKEADLTEAERVVLTKWCQSIMDTLKANYPADSLKLKRPQAPANTK